jgi:hypothetical protein
MKREFLMWRMCCTAGKLSLGAGGCLDTVNPLVPVRASAERVQSARRNEDPYQHPRCRLSQDVSYRAILVGRVTSPCRQHQKAVMYHPGNHSKHAHYADITGGGSSSSTFYPTGMHSTRVSFSTQLGHLCAIFCPFKHVDRLRQQSFIFSNRNWSPVTTSCSVSDLISSSSDSLRARLDQTGVPLRDTSCVRFSQFLG